MIILSKTDIDICHFMQITPRAYFLPVGFTISTLTVMHGADADILKHSSLVVFWIYY